MEEKNFALCRVNDDKKRGVLVVTWDIHKVFVKVLKTLHFDTIDVFLEFGVQYNALLSNKGACNLEIKETKDQR
ncbi:hypothetical protein D3C72_1231970 [compost metagenome]